MKNLSSENEGQSDGITSQLSAMLLTEESIYTAHDFLHLCRRVSKTSFTVWRERVTHWYFDVVDHVNASRSSVYVAMNILDRFRVQFPNFTSDKDYETAALTALFLALSIQGDRVIEISDLVRISRLGVTMKEILHFGKQMTNTLSFERKLFTPSDFISIFVDLLRINICGNRCNDIIENANYLVELCIIDSYFIGIKASETALASLVVVMGEDSALLVSVLSSLMSGRVIENALGLCVRIEELKDRIKNVDGPHVIPESDDDFLITIPSEVICRRCNSTIPRISNSGIADLSASTDNKSTIGKRPVSPVDLISCKPFKKYRTSR
jgi:Cyclin, N-terminal domain/Cyclin, C-terminal domain